MTANFSEVLIEVWRQALVDKADTVKLGSRRYPVVILKAKHLRQVTLDWEGKSIIGIEQKSNTTSRWAAMARSDKGDAVRCRREVRGECRGRKGDAVRETGFGTEGLIMRSLV
jgi:hypothetical protein